MHELLRHEAKSAASTPNAYTTDEDDQILTEANGRRTAPVFRMTTFEDVPPPVDDALEDQGNGFPHDHPVDRVMGGMKKVSTVSSFAGSVINSSPRKQLDARDEVFAPTTSGMLQVHVARHTVSVH
jgi:hypothetical protein